MPHPAIIVLAAGKGTRMQSARPKVLHPVAGVPMLAHVLHTAEALKANRTVVVIGPGMEEVAAAAKHVLPKAETAVQAKPLGTGDAVKAAAKALAEHHGTILILYGDTPLMTPETLQRMLAAEYDVTVLGMRLADPAQYGRLVVDKEGRLEAIVEYADADETERAINLCNSGVMAVRGGYLFDLLAEVKNTNAKGEYYLTDIVKIADERGLTCGVIEAPAAELMGVNSHAELAAAEYAMQWRQRWRVMGEGATLVAPETVYLAADTKIGKDVLIEPHVLLGPGVVIEDEAHIKAFCHIEGAKIGKGCVVGPFARLRPGTVLQGDNKIGNFVEVKKTTFAPGAQASHLSYIGDATVGEEANIGAGTITCNYDGHQKFETHIGKRAFIGSNTALVAPVSVGDGAMVGAGSVITDDVPAGALALARGRQEVKEKKRKK